MLSLLNIYIWDVTFIMTTSPIDTSPVKTPSPSSFQKNLETVFGTVHVKASVQSGFVYVETNNPIKDENAVLTYKIGAGGQLTPVGSPTLTQGTGFFDASYKLGPHDNDQQLALSPDKTILYAVNAGSNTISAFTIGADGTLSLASDGVFSSHGSTPISIGVGQNGQLTVVNSSEDPAQNATGSTPAPVLATFNPTSSAVNVTPLPATSLPTQALSVDGGKIIVTTSFPNDGTITSYKYDNNDNLVQVSQVTPPNGGLALGLTTVPGSQYIYTGLPNINELGVYKYDTSGQLSFVSAIPNSGQALCWIVPSDDGRFLVTANTGDDSVSVYDLSNPALPKEIQHVSLGGIGAATELSFSPDGKYVYVLEQEFSPDSSGKSNLLHVLSFNNQDGRIQNLPDKTITLPVAAKTRPFGVVSTVAPFTTTQFAHTQSTYQTYNGGNATYSLDAAADQASNTVINLTPSSSGSIKFTPSGTSSSTNNILAFGSNASPSNTYSTSVDLTNLGNASTASPTIIAAGLGSSTSFTINPNLSSSALTYNIFAGLSDQNRVQVFVEPGNSAPATSGADIQNSLLVLNGTTAPKTFNAIDEGGNLIFAGADTLNVGVNNLHDRNISFNSNLFGSQTLNSPLLSSTSVVAAGKGTGVFNVEDSNAIATNLDGEKGAVDQRHLDVVLNTLTGNDLSYAVNQSSQASANIFQQNGALDFTGRNSTLVLNNATLSNIKSTLALSGNDTVWNGNGSSTITQLQGTNTIVVSGQGGITITGKTAATSSTVAPNLLQITSAGNNATGTVTYTQDSEDTTIGGLQGNLKATLGKGSATIDLGSFTEQTGKNFQITIGLGNEVFNNFTALSNKSAFHLSDKQSVTSANFVGGNTVFSLNTGNTITFTGVDVHSQPVLFSA